jgi:DNA sulfur modification protein DndB
LQRSQQMFADLNKHAVNTTRSIGILYDFRDPLALATKEIVHKNEFLRQYVDSESPTLAQLSPKLYTLSSIYSTMKNLLRKTKSQTVSLKEVELALTFWDKLYQTIPEWRMVAAKELAAAKLRSNYITGFSVFLEAVGQIGASLYLEHGDTSFSKLEGLSNIDWTKSNPQWVGRALSNAGRVSNSLESVRLTSNKIKKHLNIPLSDDDMKYENKLQMR